jgi:hypothetical protein
MGKTKLIYRCKRCGLQERNKYAIFFHSCFENDVETAYMGDKIPLWGPYSYEKR